MKRCLSPLAIVAMLLAFCAARSWAQSSRSEIVHAEYGSGNTWVDVTARVQSLVRGDSLIFRADNDTLGGDPAPGTVKSLRLSLRDEYGTTTVAAFREKDTVSIAVRTGRPSYPPMPAPPVMAGQPTAYGSLQITRAQYGAGGHYFDVADRLNSQIQNNQLTVYVSNDTMGGDPSYTDVKSLTVWYTYNGYASQVTVGEHDTLNLPVTGGSGAQYSASGNLQILRAEYGVGNRFADVTGRLASQVQNGQLSLRVTNDTMGGDPDEDRVKTLVVWYVYNGRVAQTTVNEKDTINLPGPNDFFQGNLRILRAQYGADYRYTDVTDLLNSQIHNDQLNLRILNDTMGGDPAPDRPKQLTVLYLWNGQRYRATVNEKSSVSLPQGGAALGWDYRTDPGGGLQILQATYGERNRERDVTERLRGHVSGNQLQFTVKNSALGGDPAEGKLKRLRVIYMWQGMRYQTTVGEGETLVIP